MPSPAARHDDAPHQQQPGIGDIMELRTVVPKSVVKPYPDDEDDFRAHEYHVTLSDNLPYSIGGFAERKSGVLGIARHVILIRTPNGLEDGPTLTEAIAEEFKALGAAVPEVKDAPDEAMEAV